MTGPTTRTGPRAAATIAALAVLAASALVACSDDEGVTAPGPATTSPSTPTTTVPAPTDPAAPTTTAEPALDPLDWRSVEHRGQPIDLRRYRDGFLGLETQGIARLRADGSDVWRWTPPTKDDTRTFFVGDEVVAAEPDVRRGDHAVVALDARTGRELWTRPSNGYATADDSRVFLTTCVGERENDPFADCTITAYDGSSGAALWANPLGTYTEYVFVVDDRLLVQTFRDGRRSSFLLLDAASGALVDSDVDDVAANYVVYPVGEDRMVVLTDDADAADGCRPTTTLYDTSGAALWSTSVRTTPQGKGRKKTCADLSFREAGRDVVVGGFGSPVYLLDGETGKVRWRVPRAQFVEVGTPRVVIVTGDTINETVAYDVRTGEEAWRLGLTGGGWDVSGRYLATNTDCDGVCDAVVVDARTGEEVLRVPGVPEVYVAPRRPGGRTALLVRIDDPESYRAAYGFVTLPRLGS